MTDWQGFVSRKVVIMLKKLHENPLGPPIKGRIAGAHLTAPVEAKSDIVQLFPITGDVLLRGYSGVGTSLNGVLLGRKPKRIVSHGVQDIEAAQPLVARQYVAGDVAQWMPNVKPGPGRVGEHIEDIVLGFVVLNTNLVNLVFLPPAAPFRLDFGRTVLQC